jgi:TetR/AcrR family transcriptional repressor of nem operon
MSRNAAETEGKILDLAESLIRKNGYNGVSFRDLASGIGVKSSSVHYYFPTKEDLGAKVARRYTDRSRMRSATLKMGLRPRLK